jgi:nicotinamide mononucleotide transporter
MSTFSWLSNNFIEIFGALAGIVYVFLEIRQNLWLWPVGIATSATYIWIFFSGKLYADMGLQVYYLVISVLGWYWWVKGDRQNEKGLKVTRLPLNTGIILTALFLLLYFLMWFTLDRFTDSPVPAWDSFITSLSIIATWMLARKIYEHWFLWIVVNIAAAALFFTRGLYPTVILYIVYCAMSFVGLIEWKKSLHEDHK